MFDFLIDKSIPYDCDKMNELKNLLERLSNAHGVSGYEGSVRQVVEEEVKPYVDEIKMVKFTVSSVQNRRMS
jgi:hypothetical protein